MKSFTNSLVTARALLLEEFAKQSAQLRQQISQLDALLAENGVDVSSLPSHELALAGKKRRGRRPGSRNKATNTTTTTTNTTTKDNESADTVVAKKKAAKKGGRGKRKDGFNATGAVRAVVADMKKPFTVGDLRNEFEKRHPGVLANLNRIVLSLALQSMSRKGEVTGKKDPNGKGNIFTKTSKLSA